MKVLIHYICCDRYFMEDGVVYSYAIRGTTQDGDNYFTHWQGETRNKKIEDIEAGTLIAVSQLEEIKEDK